MSENIMPLAIIQEFNIRGAFINEMGLAKEYEKFKKRKVKE